MKFQTLHSLKVIVSMSTCDGEYRAKAHRTQTIYNSSSDVRVRVHSNTSTPTVHVRVRVVQYIATATAW